MLHSTLTKTREACANSVSICPGSGDSPSIFTPHVCVISILAPCAALTFSGFGAILILVTRAPSVTNIEDTPESMKACVFGMANGTFVVVALLHVALSGDEFSSGQYENIDSCTAGTI